MCRGKKRRDAGSRSTAFPPARTRAKSRKSYEHRSRNLSGRNTKTSPRASVRRLRHHGLDPGADIVQPSTNYRLADILCAIGIPQLRRLDELLAGRARIAAGYTERLAGVVDVPDAGEGDTHGWQAYVIRLDRRAEAMETLRAEGIEVQIGTYALHHLSAYRDQGPFPGADAAFERALALPLHSRLTDADLDRVAAGIERFA